MDVPMISCLSNPRCRVTEIGSTDPMPNHLHRGLLGGYCSIVECIASASWLQSITTGARKTQGYTACCLTVQTPARSTYRNGWPLLENISEMQSDTSSRALITRAMRADKAGLGLEIECTKYLSPA